MNRAQPARLARTSAMLGLALGASLLLAGLPGCDEDDRPSRFAELRGQLVATENGAGVGPYRVSLYDIEELRTVALTMSDDEGRFIFEPFLPGDYVPVVHANDRQVFHLPQARWNFFAGDEVEVVLPLVSIDPGAENVFRVRGRVVDDATDEPIVNASVEMTAPRQGLNFSEFLGRATLLETTTDLDGNFEIGPLPFLIEPDQSSTTPSWRVSHRDYLDVSMPGYDENFIPASVTVRMVGGLDSHAFAGRVTDLAGTPVEGVSVLAEWRRGPGELSKGELSEGQPEQGKIVVTTPLTTTDEEGRYLMRYIPAGFFNVRAALYTDDGWLGETNTGQGVEMPVDSILVELPDLFVIPATRPLAPPEAANLDTLPLLEWEPVPGATLYQARVRRARDGAAVSAASDQTAILVGGLDFFLEPGLYVWTVDAFAESGQIAGSERARAYLYAPREAPGSLDGLRSNPGWTPEDRL